MFRIVRACRNSAILGSRATVGRGGRKLTHTTNEILEDASPKDNTVVFANKNHDIATTGNGISNEVSFEKLLRNSPFMQMGDPNGAIVVGNIIETMEDSLYIDFGGKFHCVCKKPRHKSHLYTRGAKVKLRLIDLELASKFMGSKQGITLHEADATLLGLYKEPSQQTEKEDK